MAFPVNQGWVRVRIRQAIKDTTRRVNKCHTSDSRPRLKLRHGDSFAIGCETTMCTTEWMDRGCETHTPFPLVRRVPTMIFPNFAIVLPSSQWCSNSSALFSKIFGDFIFSFSLVCSSQVQKLNQMPTASNSGFIRSFEIHLCSPCGSSSPTSIGRVQRLTCMQSRRCSPNNNNGTLLTFATSVAMTWER